MTTAGAAVVPKRPGSTRASRVVADASSATPYCPTINPDQRNLRPEEEMAACGSSSGTGCKSTVTGKWSEYRSRHSLALRIPLLWISKLPALISSKVVNGTM